MWQKGDPCENPENLWQAGRQTFVELLLSLKSPVTCAGSAGHGAFLRIFLSGAGLMADKLVLRRLALILIENVIQERVRYSIYCLYFLQLI